MKTKIVVVNENLFGYVYDTHPDVLNILSSSVIRGASFASSQGGQYQIGTSPCRPATIKDFNNFRVRIDGYLTDKNCDFIKE